MKLWKTKKSALSTSSCVPGKSATVALEKSEDGDTDTASTILSVNRAMSPAQSEDSGLAADRCTTYATISLPRENINALGIVFAERPDLSYPPVIGSLNVLGLASDYLASGDRIHQIDGVSTVGLNNSYIHSLLSRGDGPAIVEIEYSLPEYISQNSLCVISKLAQITIERENYCLGLTLRGGGELPLIVTNVRPHGPVFKTSRIKPGDRLLRVDNISLINKTLSEAQQILKFGQNSGFTNLTIEYDVSVMQSVEFCLGPLLIEIERPMNDKLGLVLSNFTINDPTRVDEISPAGVYIASILPASIADRCGALTVGDQILSIDETIIENTALSPEDVMALLDGNCNRCYTQIQIMPAHTLIRNELPRSSPKYGFNTMESRRHRQKKIVRKSSLPMDSSTLQNSNMGICRSETFQVALDCSHGSGLSIGQQASCGKDNIIIAQVLPDSVADRSGCIQKNDRILSVNKLYNLEINTIRQILGDLSPKPTYHPTSWVELEIEFNMADSVIPSSGVFNVKLAKTNKSAGLGITVNGTSHGTYVISEVKPGSPAHRTGSLRAGDLLLAVDSHQLQPYNIDSLLKENTNDFTTLTIKRNSLPDFLFDAQQRSNTIYSLSSGGEETYGYIPKYNNDVSYEHTPSLKINSCPEYFPVEETRGQSCMVQTRRPYTSKPATINANEIPTIGRVIGGQNTQSMTTEVPDDHYNDIPHYDIEYSQTYVNFPPSMEPHMYGTHQLIQNVRLETNGGPLGITLAGSEDLQKPIVISGVTEGGHAYQSGNISIGDCLLSINGENVQGFPLSHATKLLQNIESVVDLKISRNINQTEYKQKMETSGCMPQPQAVYARVQRRAKSPSITDAMSSSSKDERFQTLQVTLYKDKVYDDYGFSVSDGLYERGVYINRMRSGGPADKVGILKPYDRIIQVNGTKTQDFDCCLTVPLIASAGDKIDLTIQRSLPE